MKRIRCLLLPEGVLKLNHEIAIEYKLSVRHLASFSLL